MTTPNKRGRPKLAKAEARGRFISTRVSPAEYSEITQAIRMARTPKTAWVRNCLISAARSTIK